MTLCMMCPSFTHVLPGNSQMSLSPDSVLKNYWMWGGVRPETLLGKEVLYFLQAPVFPCVCFVVQAGLLPALVGTW